MRANIKPTQSSDPTAAPTVGQTEMTLHEVKAAPRWPSLWSKCSCLNMQPQPNYKEITRETWNPNILHDKWTFQKENVFRRKKKKRVGAALD